MPTMYGDAETRSAISLREAGAHVYAADPSTEILFLCLAVDDGPVDTWRRGDPVPAPFLAAAADPSSWKIVVDNWEFERALYDHILIPRYGFPPLPLSVFDCAQRLALANSYPAELGLRAEALGLLYRKDPAARRAMLAISRPMKPRGKKKRTTPQWDEDPAKYALVLERCKLDVITTRACWNAPQFKHLSETERGYLLLDARINDRGVRADVEFVNAGREMAQKERIAINLRLAELTDGAISSVDQVQRVLAAVNSHGHRMSSVNKRAVAAVLAGKPDDFVRELLTLRRNGAHASVKKYQRVLAYADPRDQRMRGTLRIYGAGPGRWSGLGPQLQNLKRNDGNLPLELIEAVRRGDREALARYGNSLTLIGDLSRAGVCAKPDHILRSGDFGQIESRKLAWFAGEQWKLDGYAQFDATGDRSIEVYRVVAHRMLQKTTPVSEITQAERQIGKAADLAAGFGGSVGAWRKIAGPEETRTDDEIKANIRQWRDAHPAICRFWKELARAIRVAIRSGQPILVAPAPRPPIVAAFAGGNLTLTLPSGRAITYPQAKLVPGKFEDGDPDVQFMDNAHGQWKPYRGWFGTFVENVVQGCARDLLAAAIARFEARGIPVVLHCHDEVTCEVPEGTITEAEFLRILLEPPAWAAGLPLGGKVHSGSHYLEPPETPAQPLAPSSGDELVEIAVDEYLEETRDVEITDPVALERADEEDYVAELEDHVAPLTELVTLPLTPGNHVSCPFHDDPNPSCSIYPDHFHCHGCGEHGGRLDWLIRAEGMTHAEAMLAIHDWTAPARRASQNGGDRTNTYAFAMGLWTGAGELRGTIAERYLAEPRGIDVTRLPANVHDSLRFHPHCVFGPGTRLPCLLALMRNPLTDAPTGIQRIALTVTNGKVQKLDRKMLGHTGVVKLWPATDRLVVGEGLETVLAAATRIPYEGTPLIPAWAALSDGNMAKLPVLPGVSDLILLVDNDGNQMGQRAAEKAQRRWESAGRVVTPLIPNTVGKDFNDLVLEGDFDAA